MSSQDQPLQPSAKPSADDLRIESWKQIAAFFSRDQRTVKRWEKSRNLPIRRLPGEKGGVFAYASELNEWLHSAGKTDDYTRSREEEVPAGPPTSRFETLPETRSRLPVELSGPDAAADKWRADWTRIFWPVAAASIVVLCLLALAASMRERVATKSADFSPAPLRSPSIAQELYLQGRYDWNHRTAGTLRRALGAFNQAIVKDPSFAPAYAGLADCYDLMPQYAGASGSDAFPRAIAAARKALALDSSLPEAHRALAFGLFYGEWDVNGAFREFQRAIELAPTDAETHSWFATSLMLLGRLADARIEIARARELNPTSRSILANQAFILYNSDDHRASIEKLKMLEAGEPDYLGPSGYLAQIYFAERNYAAYVLELKHIAEVSGEADQQALSAAASHGWSTAGERGLLRQLRNVYLGAFRGGKSSGFELAQVDTLLGLRQEADQFLQAAVNARDYRAIAILNGQFDALMQGDRDFLNIKQEIRSRMRL